MSRNKARLARVAEAILAHKRRFAMNMVVYDPDWDHVSQEEAASALCSQEEHTCQTAGCVAGFAWACAMHDPDYEPEWENREGRLLYLNTEHVMRVAADYLGLRYREAGQLFLMQGANHRYEEVTPGIAAVVLEHLAATGEVDWDGALGDE